MTKKTIALFWFRRDLRLEDNTALFRALNENENVLPVFIFDTTILSKLENTYDRRVDFIHQALEYIQLHLLKIGSTLQIEIGEPLQVFKKLLTEYKISAVYTNTDYEPAAIERDEQIKNLIEQHHGKFLSFKDQCIFEKNEVIKDDGKPYTIFTPYSNKWKSKLEPKHYSPHPSEKHFGNFLKQKEIQLPSLEQIGFKKTDILFNPPETVKQHLLTNYKLQRDYPAIPGTSRMSMHLRFGTVSIRKLVANCIGVSDTWLNELIWREFYMMILWHFPQVVTKAFKPKYDHIKWSNNEEHFEKWCKGQTGFPIVDAGMRELNKTGFMHNRVRMIVSSFLIKDLLIDWRWGEAYFAQKLNDFDLSANNGGWQWAASSGCDAAPYFRIFNPTEQQKRFDPNFEYIKKWVPEFGTNKYPQPIVDHANARLRTLAVYKEALSEMKQGGLFD